MANRLTCPPARVAEVAGLALCDARTVERYLTGLHMLRATESLITKAIRELPAPAQMELAERRTIATELDGTTTVLPRDFAPPPVVEYTNDVRPLPRPLVIGVPLSPERCAQLTAEMRLPPRPRLRLEMPPGVEAPEPDGRHWYEERTAT